MKLFPRTVLLALVAGTVLAGCAGKRSEPETETETAKGAPLARQITTSDYCGLTAPGLVYLDSSKALQAFSSLNGQMISLASAAGLDFQREHLLVIALGRKPTGGYALTLNSAVLEGKKLALTAHVRTPSPDRVVTQALTTPCAVVAVTAKGWNGVEVRGNGLTPMTRSR